MKTIVPRNIYLKQLVDGRQNGFIKIVTGMRRCGKSTLLQVLFKDYLLEQGVSTDHIISIALDDRINLELRNPDNLLVYLRKQIVDNQLYYILMDEIQMSGLLRKGIENLPPQKREICELKISGNITNQEIAEKMNISVHTVKSHYQESIKMLRNYFKKIKLMMF